MKKRLLPLIGLLAFSLTACGTKGDTGAQGPQGEQGVPGQNGQDGKDGTNGVDGKDGTSVLTGNGEPAASLGKDGDSYIDLDNWNYYVKENGSWVSKGNIKGEDGQNGQDGTNGNNGQDGTDGVDGQDGTSMLSGSGEPASSLGKDGDSYIDIATWNYYVKENGTWVLKGNIKAEDGQNGQDGVDGQDGTSMLSGNGEPASSLGKDGDSYIDLDNWNYYVKENGSWVSKGNIKGSTGPTGDQGVSITSTYIDTNGDLIVVLSDGTEINAGHIKDNPTYHTVTFDPNGGTSVASQQVKHLEKVAKPADPILEGYFLGSWRYRDEVWSFGGNVVTEDMTLVANWLPKLNDLNIASEDTSKGTVSIDGSGYSDETITVTASAESNYVFKGWYNGYTKVSEDPAYTFTMPKEDYSLVAHFFSLDEDRYAKRPDISLDGKTMTYGLYPQSQVDSALESTLDTAKSSLTPDSNGWYLYEDTFYAEAGNNWFKCEPIIWSIFSDNNSGEYTLLSKIALDAHCFYHDKSNRTIGEETILPNNYEYSDIRPFLTNEFYNSAFHLDDSYIKPTAISTSMTDNVFLLTLNEYLHNWNYPRLCEVSAWSRARGMNTLGGSTCRYWARTPGNGYDFTANIIYEDGGYGTLDVRAAYLGVRPAITLTLS